MVDRNVNWVAVAVGSALQLQSQLKPPTRDERGLSQSTENAVLITGGVALALIVIGAVTAFVRSKLGELG